MVTYQSDYINKFEKRILKRLKKKNYVCKEKVFIGFEYGFFKGINIYYGNLKSYEKASDVNEAFKKEKLRVRLFTNFFCNYDVIIFLGYTNNINQRVYIDLNIAKIEKALSSL